MREIFKLTWRLLVIALVAGLALGATNELTKGPIREQVAAAADAARILVLPDAEHFELVSEGEGGCDNAFMGLSGSNTVGFTAQATANGYGGKIEVIIGVDLNGIVTGINVGGAGFSETSGLGSKVRNEEFKAQFKGGHGVFGTNGAGDTSVDAVTGATTSSAAVVSAVNTAYAYLLELMA